MDQSFIQYSGATQAQTIRRLIFFGITLLVATPFCFLVDLQIARNVNYTVLPGDLRTILACSEAFSHMYGVTLILLAIWFSAPSLRTKLKGIALMLCPTCVVVTIAKNTVLRIRPRQNAAGDFDSVWDTFEGINPVFTELDFSRIGESTFQSYPSGHTAMAFVLAIGLTLTLPRSRGFFFLFAVLAAGQRIGFAAHFLSDVVAGAAFAMISSAVFLSTNYARRVFFSQTESETRTMKTEEIDGIQGADIISDLTNPEACEETDSDLTLEELLLYDERSNAA